MSDHATQPEKTSPAPLFNGKGGYTSLTSKTFKGARGAILTMTNPTNKVNTVPPEALLEINQALDLVENEAGFTFLIIKGTADKIHAGADVKMFSGGLTLEQSPPDYEKIRAYLHNGTLLDLRIKKLSRKSTIEQIFEL